MNYYHIDKQTLTIISGPHTAGAHYIKKLTHCGNPELLDLSVYDLVPEIWPELAAGYQYGGEPTVRENMVEMGVVVITQAEVAAQLKAHITNMDQAARAHIDTYAHWTAGPLIWEKAKDKTKCPKSWEIKNWAEVMVWGLYRQRCLALLNGTITWSDDLLDFSSAGPIPYSPFEAMVE